MHNITHAKVLFLRDLVTTRKYAANGSQYRAYMCIAVHACIMYKANASLIIVKHACRLAILLK